MFIIIISSSSKRFSVKKTRMNEKKSQTNTKTQTTRADRFAQTTTDDDIALTFVSD